MRRWFDSLAVKQGINNVHSVRGAVFFDRDGTLIHDTGYLSDPELVELLPGVRETLLALREAGFLLFLFTNQSGVARGYFGMDAVEAVNARLARLLGAESGPFFDGVCVAPEHPDDPPVYRKPCPRYILETIAARGLAPRNTLHGDFARKGTFGRYLFVQSCQGTAFPIMEA